MSFKAKIAPSAARREEVYYCTVVVLSSEAQSYLAVWSNKSVVGGIRGLKEELYDGERAYACSEHQWSACYFALKVIELCGFGISYR